MKFDHPSCPICNKPAEGIVEHTLTEYGLTRDTDGNFAYNGDYEHYDSEPVLDAAGNCTLFCRRTHNYEEWLAKEIK